MTTNCDRMTLKDYKEWLDTLDNTGLLNLKMLTELPNVLDIIAKHPDDRFKEGVLFTLAIRKGRR